MVSRVNVNYYFQGYSDGKKRNEKKSIFFSCKIARIKHESDDGGDYRPDLTSRVPINHLLRTRAAEFTTYYYYYCGGCNNNYKIPFRVFGTPGQPIDYWLQTSRRRRLYGGGRSSGSGRRRPLRSLARRWRRPGTRTGAVLRCFSSSAVTAGETVLCARALVCVCCSVSRFKNRVVVCFQRFNYLYLFCFSFYYYSFIPGKRFSYAV